MEIPDDQPLLSPSLRGISLSLLLFPCVLGWTFLAMKITVWVLQFFERGHFEEVSSFSAKVRADGDDRRCVPVSPVDIGFCPGRESSIAASDYDDSSDGVGGDEDWDDAAKNSLWEEFYGVMGEEELDNLSNYSPR